MQVAAVLEDGEKVAPGVPEVDIDRKVPLRREFQLDAEGLLLEGAVLVAFVVVEADLAHGDDAPFPVGEHLVDLLLPVRAHRAGIQAYHRVQHAGIPVVDHPEGVPLAAVHVGLDHLAHPGGQGARHGGVGVRQEPFVVEMGMGVDEQNGVICGSTHKFTQFSREWYTGGAGPSPKNRPSPGWRRAPGPRARTSRSPGRSRPGRCPDAP